MRKLSKSVTNPNGKQSMDKLEEYIKELEEELIYSLRSDKQTEEDIYKQLEKKFLF